jgi:plasmid stabilization system protein ParE
VRREIWSKDARADLAGIVRYFAGKDPEAAKRIVERVRDAARKLARRDIGRKGRMPGIREKRVLKTRYIIAYAWSERKGAIVILRVIHSSQNWTSEAWPKKD